MGPQGRPHRAALCNGVKVGVLAGNLRGQLALAHSNRAPTASSAVVTSEHLGRIAFPALPPANAPQDVRGCWGGVGCGGSYAPSGRVVLRNPKALECRLRLATTRRGRSTQSPCLVFISYQHRPANKTAWPSGLRRWLKATVRKGVGSNPSGGRGWAVAEWCVTGRGVGGG